MDREDWANVGTMAREAFLVCIPEWKCGGEVTLSEEWFVLKKTKAGCTLTLTNLYTRQELIVDPGDAIRFKDGNLLLKKRNGKITKILWNW